MISVGNALSVVYALYNICHKFIIYFMVVVIACAGLARAEGVDKINASPTVPLQDNTLLATLGSISCPSSVHFFVVMTDDRDLSDTHIIFTGRVLLNGRVFRKVRQFLNY